MKKNIHITLATAIAILVGAWLTGCNENSHEGSNENSHEGSNELNCDPGYHIYDDTCEADSITNCGSHGKECNIENAATTTCSDGICKVTCNTGYHPFLDPNYEEEKCEENSLKKLRFAW